MRLFIHFLCLALLPVPGYTGERGPVIPDYPTDRVAKNTYVIHGPLTTPNPENQPPRRVLALQ